MNDNVTKKDLQEFKDDIELKIDKAVTDLSEIVANLAQSMHDQIVELKKDNADLKDTLNRLMNTIDGFCIKN